jgi:UDP-N-acetylglucosamine acyltransferase
MTSIHSTAVVSPEAQIGSDVTVGPYCVVGPHVCIGDGATLMSHVVLDGYTRIGAKCILFPFASIGTQTQDLKFKGARTSVEIGDGTTIREYVTVNSGTNEGEVTRVGAGCHIMAYCHVAHACQLGNGVIMANGSTLAGEVIIEDQAGLGGMTGVHQFVKIGRLCFIGGMSRITKDCPPFMLIEGNPPEAHGINSVGMERRGITAEALRHVKQAHQILYRQNLSTSQAVEKIKAEIPLSPEIEHLLSFIASSKRGIIK